jgi:hypothetical protein
MWNLNTLFIRVKLKYEQQVDTQTHTLRPARSKSDVSATLPKRRQEVSWTTWTVQSAVYVLGAKVVSVNNNQYTNDSERRYATDLDSG